METVKYDILYKIRYGQEISLLASRVVQEAHQLILQESGMEIIIYCNALQILPNS